MDTIQEEEENVNSDDDHGKKFYPTAAMYKDYVDPET
jgi:hypothetical protein